MRFCKLTVFALIITALLAAACSQEAAKKQSTRDADELVGIIEGANPETRSWQVRETTSDTLVSVQVSPADFSLYEVGEAVSGQVAELPKGKRLERIWPAEKVPRGIMEQINRQLRQDTLLRGSKPFRGEGETMPAFALWDQHGQLLNSRSLQGRYVVLNFIFTRCTQPNMCPLSTAKMKRLQELAAEHGFEQLQLVSISLDPDYDTPAIMQQYLKDNAVDQKHFAFLSGKPQVVEDLKAQIGVFAEKDEALIVKHTLMTTVFDPFGKIIYRVPGSGWSPEDVLERIESHQSALKES